MLGDLDADGRHVAWNGHRRRPLQRVRPGGRSATTGRNPGASRGVFEVDEDGALAELERAWAGGGYHGSCIVEHSLWSAISSSGEVLTGNPPDGLDQQIRAHWQALR